MKLKKFNDDNINGDAWEIVASDEMNKLNYQIKNKKVRNKWILLPVIILFLTLPIIYFMNFKNSDNSVFRQYYTSENILNITRGNNKSVDAIIEFQEKDFQTSSYMFKQILTEDSSNIVIRFYYGISCIEINNYLESIKSFKYIIQDNNNLYVEHAEWYLALCYLKSGQKENAIKQFEIIRNDKNSYYKKEAESILIKIK